MPRVLKGDAGDKGCKNRKNVVTIRELEFVKQVTNLTVSGNYDT